MTISQRHRKQNKIVNKCEQDRYETKQVITDETIQIRLYSLTLSLHTV